MQAPPFTATLHWAPQNTRSHMHKYKWNSMRLKQAKEQCGCFVLVTEQWLLQGERDWRLSNTAQHKHINIPIEEMEKNTS